MSTEQKKAHQVFILMGVSGSGKSAVAGAIAAQLGAVCLDGDFLHPRANICKMASGQSLDDQDRAPWLTALNDAIFAMQRTNEISLLVCSALKQRYRDKLRAGNQHVSFLYLKGSFALIEQRLKARKGHFFKPQMLVSQFETLQEPGEQETDVYAVDINQPLDGVVADAVQIIQLVRDKA
ncbi:gluconokinase [Brenneria sp. 4F2]|nr:gluconokinase [Brenneria bubanii]